MKSIKVKSGHLAFEIICATLLLLTLYFHISIRFFGPGILAIGLILSTMAGIYLSFFKKIKGVLFALPLSFSIVLAIPISLFGTVLMAGMNWVLVGFCLAAWLLCFFIWDYKRALVIALSLLIISPVFLIKPILDGDLGAGCSDTANPLSLKGEILISDYGAGELICGNEPGVLIASTPSKGKIRMLSLSLGEVMDMAFPKGQPVLMGEGESLIAAYDDQNKKVTIIDRRYLSKYQSVDLAGYECNPISAAVSRVQLRGLILCGESRTVQFLDSVRGSLARETDPLARIPYMVRINNQLDRGYVTDLLGSYITELEIEGQRPLRKIKVGFAQTDIGFGDGGSFMYVARPLQGRVDVFDLHTSERVNEFPAPRGVTRISIDDRGKRLFAAAYATGHVYIVDLTGNTEPLVMNLNAQITDLAYCTESDLVFYATRCSIKYFDPARFTP